MKILGIDTTTKFLCIGIGINKDIYEYCLNLGKGHDLYLINHLRRILESLRIKIEQIDYLVVGLGPGSFTGARIGISAIKGIACALNKKVIGVSTLEIIAYNALNYTEGNFVCPVLDAKRGLLYSALYYRENRSLKEKIPAHLWSIDEMIKNVPPNTLFLGDGLNLYKSYLMAKTKEAYFLDEDFFWPKATYLLESALKYIRGKKFISLDKLKPIYLYPAHCQVKNTTRD